MEEAEYKYVKGMGWVLAPSSISRVVRGLGGDFRITLYTLPPARGDYFAINKSNKPLEALMDAIEAHNWLWSYSEPSKLLRTYDDVLFYGEVCHQFEIEKLHHGPEQTQQA